MLIKIINDNGFKHWNLIADLFNQSLEELAMINPNCAKPTVLRNGK